MRYREAFSLYRRKLDSGKVIFYYHVYDDDGNRVCGHSTGKSTRTAAREYCHALLREGKLLPKDQMRIPTFAEFAKGWWDFETCAYLKRKAGRRPMTRSYADVSKHRMNKHVIPYFGKMRLDRITNIEIENWLTTFSEKDLKNQTANGCLIVLKVMLGEAARSKITSHSWRHFFNTTLRMANVADSKVQSVTGHSSQAMTDWYTHYNTAELSEVRRVQEDLFISEKAAGQVEAVPVRQVETASA